MPLHIGKRQTTSTAIAKIIDYAENPEKTDNGRLITGYECDAVTADTEFVLARQQYIQLTGRRRGRDDVIGYHLRQAFLPGEITPEEANQVGYELAMKLTKGNNAFVVCTYIDKHHVHNHIIICSINLDGKRKFRNFWNSAWAIRRINDKLCLEHGLSVVDEPQPSKSHYGDWLGDGQKPSYQEQLRRIIDTVLEEKPRDFSEFLKRLTDYGVTVNTDRKNLRLKAPGQTKFTRCNTLRGDYTEEAIRERIEGVRVVAPRKKRKRPTVPKVGLLIDIDAAIRAGKGAGYERWAKVFNLKQLSQAVLYLKEHGDMSYEDLRDRTAAAVTRFNDLSAEIKDLEAQITDRSKYNDGDFRLGEVTQVKPYKDGSKYVYIEMTGISATNLDTTYTLKVGENTLGSFSALSYVKDTLSETAESGDTALRNVCTALYRYNKAADAFAKAS